MIKILRVLMLTASGLSLINALPYLLMVNGQCSMFNMITYTLFIYNIKVDSG